MGRPLQTPTIVQICAGQYLVNTATTGFLSVSTAVQHQRFLQVEQLLRAHV